jgi:6-phosphofructokinase 2
MTRIVTVTLNPSLDEWMDVPSLRVGALHRAAGFARYPGGKGINVSRVAHELGGTTVAWGFSGGEDGVILRHLLDRLAIPHQFMALSGATRNNYKIRTRAPRAVTEINTPGPAVPRATLRAFERRLLAPRPRPGCVVLSGSLPPGVPATIYRRWVQGLRRQQIPTVLDTSGPALRYGLQARPWLTKPNRVEAEELLGCRLTRLSQVVRGAAELVRQGPECAIISMAAEGAVLASAALAGVWLARPPRVTADSAVGAGDSLVAGIVIGRMRGRPLLEAFRLGVASGTATAMAPGTELCRRADVRRLLPRVTLRRLA